MTNRLDFLCLPSLVLTFLVVISVPGRSVSIAANSPTARIVFGKCGTGPTSNNFQRAWILNDLLGSCERDVTCIQELLHAHRRNDSEFVDRFTSAGAAYFLQLDAVDPTSWHMAELADMFLNRNVNTKYLVLVHLSDNKHPPHGDIYTSFYRQWSIVIRNYWWNEVNLIQLHREGILKWFPLGYSNHIKTPKILQNYSDMLDPSRRNIDMFFLGNKRSGNFKRGKNMDQIKRLTNFSINGDVHKGSFASGSREEYVYGMFHSKFCLQIPGRFAECYRLYDALETGCIPVFINTYAISNYSIAISESLVRFEDVFWTDSDGKYSNLLPLLRFERVEDMATGIDYLLHNKSALQAIFVNCQLWWYETKKSIRHMMTTSVCHR